MPEPGSHNDTTLRVAIIGAGPIGLEAGLAAANRGFAVDIYEASAIGGHIRQWGHVVLFTPFRMNHGEAGRRAVLADNPRHDFPGGEEYVSGSAYVERYLEPLAQTAALRGRVHCGQRVVSVARKALLKHEGIGSDRRARCPFVLLIRGDDGGERVVEADAVIDASGVYGRPNRLGMGGLPALGERGAQAFVHYGLDDVTGRSRPHYLGKRTLVVGAGYSAATTIAGLGELAEVNARTEVFWLTRSNESRPIREIENDRLPARLALARAANDLAEGAHRWIRRVGGVWVERLEPQASGVAVTTVDARGVLDRFVVDRVIANVGFRPDASVYEEVHVHQCYATEGPMKLSAALLGQRSVDCLDRAPTGAETLRNPEPGFFILGAKSYGRDSTFLLKNGLAQVEQAVGLLAEWKDRNRSLRMTAAS